MKFTDKILEKYGVDKVLHCCVAGWFVSMASFVNLWAMIFVAVAVVCLSVYKEVKLDKARDWKDLYAALFGMGLTFILYLLC